MNLEEMAEDIKDDPPNKEDVEKDSCALVIRDNRRVHYDPDGDWDGFVVDVNDSGGNRYPFMMAPSRICGGHLGAVAG